VSSNITDEEIRQVKTILNTEAGISDTMPVSEKVKVLSLFLYNRLKPQEGSPESEIKQLNAFQQYSLTVSKKTEVDCANYADIYHLFANVAGIPTRKMGVAGWVDHTGISGHVFNESFIPEFNVWAMVDLTSAKTFVFSNGKRALNTIDLLHLNLMKTYDGIYTLCPDSTYSKLDTVAYATVNASEKMHFKRSAEFYVIHPDINENMTFTETFTEYLSEKSHYGVYYSGNKRKDNSKHYLKLYVYKGSLVVLVLWLFTAMIKFLLLLDLPFLKFKG
jgi:hypothetical protein